jgi:hypothetical protein
VYFILENSAIKKGKEFEYGKGILKENLVLNELENYTSE